MTDLQPALDRLDDIPRCLSFTVEGPWAHFRQIDGNSVRRTYRAPPRTTVAGLIAAILGLPRDSYYDLFDEDVSAIAISPESELRTQNLPENILTTAKGEGMKRIGRNQKGLKLSTVDATAPRQQQNFEVITDAAYRIDCWLADEETYNDLKSHLETGTAVYTPALGLSEFLATIEYHGEFEPFALDDEPQTVTSIVPGGTAALIPTADTTTTIERTPALMETTDPSGPDGPGRRTTAYADIVVEQTGAPLRTTAPAATVDDRNVVFL